MTKISAEKNMTLDFARDVWCLLGLPLDNCSLEETCAIIEGRIKERQQCAVASPNLNWLRESVRNRDFKEATISSDLSIVDGFPLLLTARLLGIGIKEKVPGSSLMDTMMRGIKKSDYSVFFFGGKSGSAGLAAAVLGNKTGGLRAAGHFYPGFGSIEDMSGPDILRRINETRPDILLLAISMRNGMLWIDKNKDKVDAVILAPFGAALNFMAGLLKRAPGWMQKCGLEWLWRIKEEPLLWSRYLQDGLVFLRLFATRVLPYAVFLRLHRKYEYCRAEPGLLVEEKAAALSIKITGVCNNLNCGNIRSASPNARWRIKTYRWTYREPNTPTALFWPYCSCCSSISGNPAGPCLYRNRAEGCEGYSNLIFWKMY